MKITQGEINYGDESLADEKVFYLDHQCDEWIVGDIEDAKKFAKDLLDLIEKVEHLSTN